MFRRLVSRRCSWRRQIQHRNPGGLRTATTSTTSPNLLRDSSPFTKFLILSSPVLAGGLVAYFIINTLPPKPRPFNPSSFSSAKLEATESAGPDTKLLLLALPAYVLPTGTTETPIWSIYVKDPEIQVERAYTPLDGVDKEGKMALWVKKYDDGEVGKWLHKREVGDEVEVRGPVRTWNWKEGAWDEVIMISGGTGITPFSQLFHSVIARPSSQPSQPSPSPSAPAVSSGNDRRQTRFTLLHASSTPSHLPPPALLSPILRYADLHPQTLNVRLFVDAADSNDQQAGEPAHKAGPIYTVGRIGKKEVVDVLKERDKSREGGWWSRWFRGEDQRHTEKGVGKKKRILFLVCGPEPMIAALAGPFGRNMAQGVVGGVLGELGYTSSEVWKMQ